MAELERLPADAPIAAVMAVLDRDGALILEGVMSPQAAAGLAEELRPWVEATQPGQDGFTGFRTTRTGALAARSPGCRTAILDPRIRAICDAVLLPNCTRYQLHLGQLIRIMPGQPAQPIHRDRWAWGQYLKGVEPQLNTIWALTDFTGENGATQVVPGSIDWPDSRKATAEEICRATMRAGSVLVYTGTVFHGGGANSGDTDRWGLNITYALGYYTPPLPPGEGPEVVPPEYALTGEAAGSQLGSAELLEAINAQVRET